MTLEQRDNLREWRRRQRDAFTLSPEDLIAILWHQHKIRSFRKIARLTRHQIAHILCREIDKDGRVKLHGMPQRRRKDEPAAPILADYRSIFHWCRQRQLEASGMHPELAAETAKKEWLETPLGKAEKAHGAG